MEGQANSDEGKPCQLPGRMKNSSHYSARVGLELTTFRSPWRQHDQGVLRANHSTTAAGNLPRPPYFTYNIRDIMLTIQLMKLELPPSHHGNDAALNYKLICSGNVCIGHAPLQIALLVKTNICFSGSHASQQ